MYIYRENFMKDAGAGAEAEPGQGVAARVEPKPEQGQIAGARAGA